MGNFRRILGIHQSKSFSGDKLSWFGQKIYFNYCNLFLLKKQNQYAKKSKRATFFHNTHILLHPIDCTRACKTTELKVFFNVERLKLKLQLSYQNFRSKPHLSVDFTHAKAKLKLKPLIWPSKTTFYLEGIHFCENCVVRNLFLRNDGHQNKHFAGFVFANAMYKRHFA